MPVILSTARFDKWFVSLRDRRARARIQVRIDRMEDGHFGDFKSVGNGAFEARIHYGPGYRLYFSFREQAWVLLLAGGDKSSQRSDIEEAIRESQSVE